MMERLPLLEPRTDRSERTRRRCQKKLARHFNPPASTRFTIERAMCVGFAVIYLSSLALNVVRMLIW
jgi:hypothetical protein